MEVRTGESGNSYVETNRPHDEMTRVTYVSHQDWADQAVVRIQVRGADGHLRRGPEIPVDQVGDFVSSIINLLRKTAQQKT